MDDGYEAAVRTWELTIVNRPDAVVQAASLDDIDRVVEWASRHDVPVGCQSTGHGAVRAMADGILLNTSALKSMHVDPDARTATFAAGVQWRDAMPALTDQGLAALWGSSSGVGVAGYTLAGGMGPLGRLFGFAADRVRSIDVVTAEGGRIRASVDHEPDLFWGLLGAGGNLGAVRSITVDLVAVRKIYGGGIYFSDSHAADILPAWRSWAAGLDDHTSTSIAFTMMPTSAGLPPELSGARIVHVRVAHVGDGALDLAAQGDSMCAPLRSLAPALLDTLGILPMSQTDRIHNDPVTPLGTAHRGMLIDALTDDVSAVVLDVVQSTDHGGLRMVELRQMGAALGREPEFPNAVSGRSNGFHVYATSPVDLNGPEAAETAIETLDSRMGPFVSSTAQLNFRGPLPSPEAVLASWTPPVSERLLALKRDVDPRNIFADGQAIVAR
jgi:FAD/FMN-containing dehydrogenase